MKRLLMTLLLAAAVLPLAVTRTEMATRTAGNNQAKSERRVRSLRVLVPSTMLADAGIDSIDVPHDPNAEIPRS